MKKISFISINRIPLFATTIVFFWIGVINGQGKMPDYTSKVPKYVFAITLEEQEKQLKTNPLMLRFAESRKKSEVSPQARNRPIYHMTAPEGRLGDPNGLCFWNGNWHLFYQAFPPDDSRQHWGHVVSLDLIHWKDLPYAIYPGPEQAVYSGSTLVEENRVIAMYHGPLAGNMIAISDDPLLLNWNKKLNRDKAPIPMLSSSGFSLPYSVFDPCIWQEDGIYYSLSAGKKPLKHEGVQIPTLYLFRSADLINWDYMHEFVEEDRFTMTGDDFACPYFWPLGEKYILPFFSHKSGGQFLLGEYDLVNKKFAPTYGSGPSGLGPPSATPEGKEGVIIVYNLGGALTLPRRMTLLGNKDLHIEPAGNYESLRGQYKIIKSLVLPANKEVVLRDIGGKTIEIMMEIDLKNCSTLEVDVLRSPNKEEYTRIVFYKGADYGNGREYGLGLLPVPKGDSIPEEYYTKFNGSMLLFLLNGAKSPAVRSASNREPSPSIISIDKTYSSLSPINIGRGRTPNLASVFLDNNETLKLHFFIDNSIVEVFANGKQALSASVNPTLKESAGVSLRSQGQEAELKSLEAWQMKGIYE